MSLLWDDSRNAFFRGGVQFLFQPESDCAVMADTAAEHRPLFLRKRLTEIDELNALFLPAPDQSPMVFNMDCQ